MFACFGNKDKEESWAMRNGRMLLEESISLFDGKVNPIRCFSARELEIATNNFDSKQLFLFSKHRLYRGSLQGQAIIVKIPGWDLEDSIRGVVVASRLSFHKNVLKLIGCCLETEIPLAVHESFDCEGGLYDELRRESTSRPVLPWKHRLKIAVDLSNLFSYLHTALPRPLIHRDIQPHTILLDKENGVVKLFDFDLCVSLPEGEPFIEVNQIRGTNSYMDCMYAVEGRVSEKVDVFSFGFTLLNLLSGIRASAAPLEIHARNCMENGRFEELVDPRLSADKRWPPGKHCQFIDFVMLALECTRDESVDRPDMTDIGTRLAGMYRSASSYS